MMMMFYANEHNDTALGYMWCSANPAEGGNMWIHANDTVTWSWWQKHFTENMSYRLSDKHEYLVCDRRNKECLWADTLVYTRQEQMYVVGKAVVETRVYLSLWKHGRWLRVKMPMTYRGIDWKKGHYNCRQFWQFWCMWSYWLEKRTLQL